MKRQATLGIILMDQAAALEGDWAELKKRRYNSPWAVQDPNFWQAELSTAIAAYTDSADVLAATPRAIRGIADAARRLDGNTDLIIGNCGFFWAARHELKGSTATPVFVSGLDLLDLALGSTKGPVGIVTYSKSALDLLLNEHPQYDRIKMVGLDDMPHWTAISATDFMAKDDWTFPGLADELSERLTEAMQPGHVLDGVTLLILECTALPNFREVIREVTTMPILDIVSFAEAALR